MRNHLSVQQFSTKFNIIFLGAGFGANNAAGSLFGNKPVTGLGTGLGTSFGTGIGPFMIFSRIQS